MTVAEYQQQIEPIFVHRREACRMAGVGATRLYELSLKQGAIVSVKIGKSRLYSTQSIRDWAERQIRESRIQVREC
jgi:hypothetical protein